MRRIAVLLVAAAAVTIAAGAGPPVTATVTPRSGTVAAGAVWSPTITLRYGGRPARGARPRIVLTGRGTTRTVHPSPTGRAGVFRARIVLAAPGRWAYAVRVGARTVAHGVVTVRPPQAALTNAIDVAVDAAGSILVVDLSGRIFRASGDGSLTLAAGNGRNGTSGDGGPATGAAVGFPVEVAAHPRGGFAIVHAEANVRYVDPAGTIRTVAAGLAQPTALAFDRTGNLYVSLLPGRLVRIDAAAGARTAFAGTGGEGYGGDGGPALQAQLNRPHGLAVAADGGVYVADTFNHRVRRVSPDGTITTVAGTGAAGAAGAGGRGPAAQLDQPVDLALGPDGSLWIADGGSNRVLRLRPDGTLESVGRRLGSPQGIAVTASGAVLVTERGRGAVRRIDPATGAVTVFAGR